MAGFPNKEYPILEYDPERRAIIEPSVSAKASRVKPPDRCVMCFFQEVLRKLRRKGRIRRVFDLKSELGRNPVFIMRHAGKRLAVLHAGLGGPLSGGWLDQMIGWGVRKFVVAGGAGVLDGDIPPGTVIVPRSAVRDEGTSYHYMPPGREAKPGKRAFAAVLKTLKASGVPWRVGKTWTTDAFYRETRAKIERRRREGCLTVEMEAASMFAVARFRGAELAIILYGGDDVSGKVWDRRGVWTRWGARERLFRLAVEACSRM